MCTPLVTLTVACFVQTVSWPGLNVHYSGDTDCCLFYSECELALFLMCTLLVTLTVACLVSVCQLAGFLMCTLPVTLTVAYLVSVCELAWF